MDNNQMMGGMPPQGGMPTSPPMQPPVGGGAGMKKQLLQRLMSNLMNKPGRSMHEMINGVKSAIGAYKNYSKEWDTLNGVNPTGIDSASSGQKANGDIQKILQEIQQKKSSGQ